VINLFLLVYLVIIVVRFFQIIVVAQEDCNVYKPITYSVLLTSCLGGCGASNVVLFYELLLLVYHIFQVDDGAGLQLQVEQDLNVLRLQEVVLNYKFQEVLVLCHLNSLCLNTGAYLSDLIVVLVQTLLHLLTFEQVLLG